MPDRAADSCPLTAPQAGIWFAQQRDTSNPVFTTGQYVRLPAEVDPERFARAVERALGEVWGLAVEVGADGDVPVQRGTGTAPRVEVVDLSGRPDPEAVALARMRADLEQPPVGRPLVREVLFRWRDGALWFHRCHHMLLDGYGFSLVLRRIEEIHEALRTGGSPGEPAFGGLGAYLDEEAGYRAGDRMPRDRAYWLDALAELPTPVSLSGTPPEPARGAPLKARVDVLPDPAGLARLAESLSATTADLAIAATAVYQHRVTGAADVVLALPLALRGGTAARLPSTTVNVLPLRLRVAAGDTVGTLVTRLRTAMRELRRHGRYRVEDIRRDLGRVTDESEFTTAQVNIKSYDTTIGLLGRRLPVVDLSPGPVDDIAFVVDLAEDGELTALEVEANALRYDAPTALAHGRGLGRLLGALAAAGPDTAVDDLGAVGPVYDTGHYLDLRGPVDREVLRVAGARAVSEAAAGPVDGPTGETASGPAGGAVDASADGEGVPRGPAELVDLSGESDPAGAALAWMRAELARPAAAARGHAVLALGPEHHLWFRRTDGPESDDRAALALARRVAALAGAPDGIADVADVAADSRPAGSGSGHREIAVPAALGRRMMEGSRELGVGIRDFVAAAVAMFTARRHGSGAVELYVPAADGTPVPLPLDLTGTTTLAQTVAVVQDGRGHRATADGRVSGPSVTVARWAGTADRDAALHLVSAAPATGPAVTAVLGEDRVRALQVAGAPDDPAWSDGELRRFIRLLDAVTAAPETTLAGVDLLDEAEHRALAADADTAHPVPVTTLDRLVAEQIARTPDAVALVPADGTPELTYRELGERVDRLARGLTGLGAGPGTIVAVAQPRSTALVVSLLAVLRTGAAYA
ncbi:condensation domain-containing protein, partial [Streptomyces huiliensis]|uniref:condensation domain-containing protein n=1 Tax=Streptomyces huiliensis TaxID=2876027 RepID=UPI001CBD8AE0